MEKTNKVTVVIPVKLLDYISKFGSPIQMYNCTLIVQTAYDYCTKELTEEEREQKLAEIASKYYKLFTLKRETKVIHVKTTEPMKQYQASNLILLYTLIFIQDHESVLGITEENRFNV